MVHVFRFRTAQLPIALLVAGGAVAGFAQTGQSLSALTVPTVALPSGCALTPPQTPSPAAGARAGAVVIVSSGSRFPSNPWSGTDRKTVAAVHMAVDGARERPLPDVPPTTPRDTAAAELKWAENILEAYHAAYTAVDGYQVEVFAVTFNDVKLATAPEPLSAMLNPPRGPTTRIVRGTTAIRVSASTSTDCFGAVRRYIESLR